MTLIEAVDTLNSNRHHGNRGWYIAGEVIAYVSTKCFPHECYSPLEAIVIAKKYAKGSKAS